MKNILLLSSFLFGFFTLTAQYKDSLKTFQKLTKSVEKKTDFVFIPSGSFTRGSNDSDMPTPDLNGYYFRNHVVSVDSFFMQKYEVSNSQYLEFVAAIEKRDSLLGKTLLPDTLVWRTPQMTNEPYVEYYFRHPAYANYPVVGISYQQAKAFAEWQTEKYNAKEDRIFKKVCFRLPTEEEWEFAAKGGHKYAYLPWGHNATLSSEGEAYANFRCISQLSVYRDSVLIDNFGELKKRPVYLTTGATVDTENSQYNSDVTAPVNSYEPNPYGLHNMAGNAEELVDAYFLRDASIYEFMTDERAKSDAPWGVTKGGSWNDTGYYLQYPVRQFYKSQDDKSSEVGFRLVMEVLDY